jgi:hypothetical protein
MLADPLRGSREKWRGRRFWTTIHASSGLPCVGRVAVGAKVSNCAYSQPIGNRNVTC